MNKTYDFADEAKYQSDEKIIIDEKKYKNLSIKKIQILDDLDTYNAKGNYISFELDNLGNKVISDNQVKIINDYLKDLIVNLGIKKNSSILMVGLGNDDFSSDALGPNTIKKINADYFFNANKNRKISCIIPGVMKMTGLESASIIRSLVKEFDFDLVIAFDALATRNINRLYKVIQVTDTQIIPGSGINNFRKSLNKKYLGVPLIAVGVSMVINYTSILDSVLDEISDLDKLNKSQKKKILEMLDNDVVLTSKDSEEVVDIISNNLAKIFNSLFY